MTKLDLLVRAKALGIMGRHDMSKADLETAVAQREQIQQVSDAAKTAAQEIKAEVTGRAPRRRGSNLNTPWARKFYYVSLPAYEQARAEGRVAKSAMQVQLMLKFMVERGITARDQAQQGSSISTVAVSSGFVKTVIEPHVLFAYYRSKMETLGLVFAGYDLDGDDAEADDAEADDAEADAEAAEQERLEKEDLRDEEDEIERVEDKMSEDEGE